MRCGLLMMLLAAGATGGAAQVPAAGPAIGRVQGKYVFYQAEPVAAYDVGFDNAIQLYYNPPKYDPVADQVAIMVRAARRRSRQQGLPLDALIVVRNVGSTAIRFRQRGPQHRFCRVPAHYR